MSREAGVICCAVVALAALAYVLWDMGEGEPVVATVEPVAPKGSQPPAKRREPVYDGGRTTIKPLITDAAVARIRARKAG